MRKTIVLASLLTLVRADARAQDPEAEQQVREAQEETRRKADEARQDAAQETRGARERVEEGRQQTQREVRGAEREAQSQRASARGQEKKHAFEGQENFDVEGKVQKVSGQSLTIAREELPPVTLRLERYTAIEVDGETAARTQLRPGQEVQASFNLQGDKPIALEVKAKKGSGSEGSPMPEKRSP